MPVPVKSLHGDFRRVHHGPELFARGFDTRGLLLLFLVLGYSRSFDVVTWRNIIP